MIPATRGVSLRRSCSADRYHAHPQQQHDQLRGEIGAAPNSAFSAEARARPIPIRGLAPCIIRLRRNSEGGSRSALRRAGPSSVQRAKRHPGARASAQTFDRTMTFAPAAAANLAKAYELAAYKLLEDFTVPNPATGKDGLVRPSVLGPICGAAVLTALSIEVALKALLKKHTGRTSRLHDHVKLFELLPIDVQQEIRVDYRQTAEIRNTNSGGDQAMELTDVLAATKDVFSSWRYVYEPTEIPRSLNLDTAATVARVLAARCKGVQPPVPPDLPAAASRRQERG